MFDNTTVVCLLHHLVVELLILGNSTTHHRGPEFPFFSGERARHETCLYFEHKDVECAEGWQYFAHTQLCYKLMPPPKQIWYYAEKDCQEIGGHLASIKDEPTVQFILDKILKSTTLTSGLEDTPTYYFIGGIFLLL